MKVFYDSAGREWRIRLTLATVDQVLDVVKVDLLDPFGTDENGRPLVTRLRTDMRLLGKVLAELLTSSDPVSVADLREAFDGPTKAAAWKAFSDEWSDFFRQDGRPDVARAIDRHEEMIGTATKHATTEIDAIDVEKAIVFASKSGSSRESSASTLAP